MAQEGRWLLAIQLKELKEVDPPTETGMIEIRLRERLQKLGQSAEGVPTLIEEVVTREISMLFSYHLNFFILLLPLLEQNISNMLSIMKIHPNVYDDFKTRISAFAREVAEWAMSEEGPKMFSIEVNIEVLNIQVNDAEDEEDDDEGLFGITPIIGQPAFFSNALCVSFPFM